MSDQRIDSVDIKILKVLQTDGRITNADLADRVGLSPAACHKRLKRLEATSVIKAYTVMLNRFAVGCPQSVFIQVQLERLGHEGIEAFEKAVINVPEIVECHLMSGTFDYFLHVVVRDTAEFEALHRHVLTSLPGITRMTSSFGLRNVKQRGAVPIRL